MAIPKPETVQLINVHRVIGDHDGIQYLKNADHDVVEGLFSQAKRFGRAQFVYQSMNYDMIRNRDFSFTIRLSEDQDTSPEQFS